MKKIIVFFGIFICCLLFSTVHVEAAAKKTVLEPNKVYRNYDVTGDGVADTISINQSGFNSDESMYHIFEIYINRNRAYWYYDIYDSTNITVCNLKNKKAYIFMEIIIEQEYGPACGLYQYNNGKLKQVLNFKTLFKDGWAQTGKIKSVSGNKIRVRYGVMSNAAAYIEFDYIYKYKKGKLVRTSKIGKVVRGGSPYNAKYYTLNDNLSYYKKATSSKKSGTLKSGTKLKITNCYINGNKIMLKVKTSSRKTVWIKSPKKIISNYKKNTQTYFKEGVYAG